MTSQTEAIWGPDEYSECDHGVPTCDDCIECMKIAHASELRGLNEAIDEIRIKAEHDGAAAERKRWADWLRGEADSQGSGTTRATFLEIAYIIGRNETW